MLDSRPVEDGSSIRRRRECQRCGKRFTTYERVEEMSLLVVKRDGSREIFDKNKILAGLVRACDKRPVPMSTLEDMVADIEIKRQAMEKLDETSNSSFNYKPSKSILAFLASL